MTVSKETTAWRLRLAPHPVLHSCLLGALAGAKRSELGALLLHYAEIGAQLRATGAHALVPFAGGGHPAFAAGSAQSAGGAALGNASDSSPRARNGAVAPIADAPASLPPSETGLSAAADVDLRGFEALVDSVKERPKEEPATATPH